MTSTSDARRNLFQRDEQPAKAAAVAAANHWARDRLRSGIGGFTPQMSRYQHNRKHSVVTESTSSIRKAGRPGQIVKTDVAALRLPRGVSAFCSKRLLSVDQTDSKHRPLDAPRAAPDRAFIQGKHHSKHSRVSLSLDSLPAVSSMTSKAKKVISKSKFSEYATEAVTPNSEAKRSSLTKSFLAYSSLDTSNANSLRVSQIQDENAGCSFISNIMDSLQLVHPESAEELASSVYWKKTVADIEAMKHDRLIDDNQYKMKEHLKSSYLCLEPTAFRARKNRLLVLDLDETLIHYSSNSSKSLRYALPYKSPSGKNLTLRFNLRPYMVPFLAQVSRLFDVCIFTASELSYARTMVDFFDPNRQFISYVVDRRFCCLSKKGFVVKDLRIFEQLYAMDDILLVDNTAYCGLPQPASLVPIETFETHAGDCGLKRLADYLQRAACAPSIVQFNADHLRRALSRRSIA